MKVPPGLEPAPQMVVVARMSTVVFCVLQFAMDVILPEEVLLNVLRHAWSIQDVVATSHVSKVLHGVASDNNLWRHFCRRDFRNLERWSKYYNDYRDLYRRKLKTNQNWRNGTSTRCLELRATSAPTSSYNVWRAYVDSKTNQILQLSWEKDIGLATFDADSGRQLQVSPFREPMCAEKLPESSKLCQSSSSNVWIVGGNHEYPSSSYSFVKCVDMSSGEVVQQLTPPRSYVMRCVHLGGDIWATGGWANDVTIFDLSIQPNIEDSSNQIVGRLKGHSSSVRVMASTGNRTLVTGGHDSVLRVWDCTTMTCVMTLPGHSGYVLNIELRECNDPAKFFIDTIVSSGTDGHVRIWKWIDGELKLHVKCDDDSIGQIYAMAFDRERRQIISAGYSGFVQVRDEESGKLVSVVLHPAPVTCFKYDPIRQLLVTGCNDFKVRVWDLRKVDQGDMNLCCLLAASNDIVYHVDFDEDMLIMTNARSENPCTLLWDFRDADSTPSASSKTQSRQLVLLSATLLGACLMAAKSSGFPYLITAASTAVAAAVLWKIFSDK